MIVWLCEKCGCELKQEEQPEKCPLCLREHGEFMKLERKDPDEEEKKSSKKYEEVIEKLDEYTENCPPEKARYSMED